MSRAVPTCLWVDDTPLEATGFELEQPSQWLDGVTRGELSTSRASGMTGGRVLTPVLGPRDIPIVGTLIDVPMTQLQAKLEGITRMFGGRLPLRWPHAPSHVMYARCGPLFVEAANPRRAFVRPDAQTWKVRTTFTCVDSVIYDRYPQRVRLDTTARPVRLGSEASGGCIDLNGPLSGAVDVDLLTPSLVIVDRLALRNVDVASGALLRVRLDMPQALLHISALGVETPVSSWRSTSLSTRFWQVSPRWADQARDQFMHLRLSTGDGWYTYTPGHAH